MDVVFVSTDVMEVEVGVFALEEVMVVVEEAFLRSLLHRPLGLLRPPLSRSIRCLIQMCGLLEPASLHEWRIIKTSLSHGKSYHRSVCPQVAQ